MTRTQQAQADQRIMELKCEIEEWRATRTLKGPMPAALWERAVKLASEYGAYATAGALKVSPGSLYEKLKRAKDAATVGTRFVELGHVPAVSTAAPSPRSQPERHPLVLEVTGERGQRLLLRLSDEGQLSSVLPLVRECWIQR